MFCDSVKDLRSLWSGPMSTRQSLSLVWCINPVWPRRIVSRLSTGTIWALQFEIVLQLLKHPRRASNEISAWPRSLISDVVTNSRLDCIVHMIGSRQIHTTVAVNSKCEFGARNSHREFHICVTVNSRDVRRYTHTTIRSVIFPRLSARV